MVQKPDKHAVIIGASMAGLLAAAAAAEFFETVAIYERDTLKNDKDVRRGIPQGAHIHTLLGYGAESIERLLPGFQERLYGAGAAKIRRNLDIWFHDFRGPTVRSDAGITTPAMTRPLLEQITRELVLERPNITLHQGVECEIQIQEGLVQVVPHTDTSSAIIEADLVVDATGRNSHLPSILAEAGLGDVAVQELRVSMTYTSGLYRPPEEWLSPPFACLMLPVAPGQRAGYISAVEGGLWIASAFARGQDVCPRDDQGFLNWMAGLAHPVIFERLSQAEPVNAKKIYRLPSNRWRHYEKLESLPRNLIPIGESFVSLNPMYGQGMTLAAHQALALRSSCSQNEGKLFDLGRINRNYFKACAGVNQIGWTVAETRDLTFDTTEGERPTGIEDRWALQAGLSRLAEFDVEVQRLLVRVTHFLEPPSALQNPELLKRALASLD